MLNTLKAFIELAKIGNVGNISEQVNNFYRENVLKNFLSIQFFEYLKEPQSLKNIADHFQFTEKAMLQRILDQFVRDKYLISQNSTYQFLTPMNITNVRPQMFTESMQIVNESLGGAVVDRLRGKYHEFSGGLDLYNWDDTLTNRLYAQIRKGAFAFADALKVRGRFLDVGCGNGYGLAQIWFLYHQRDALYPGSNMKFAGIDPDTQLLNIAKFDFARWLKKNSDLNDEDVEKFQEFFPEFKNGTAEHIPYSDNSFDLVYTNATLHWTNAEQAIQEMVRVAKPGGIVFGTVRMFPNADLYQHLHTWVVRNAGGFFYKEDFVKWAKKTNAKEVKLGTMVSYFKIVK